jgi:hypothetical protein
MRSERESSATENQVGAGAFPSVALPEPGCTPETHHTVLTGKQFRLLAETLGITPLHGDNRLAVMVPAGETITVLSGPRPDDKRMVDVQWGDKQLMMFYEDVQKRGSRSWEIKGGVA